MRTFLTRVFDVGAAPRAAWDRLARVEDWPSWAKHIRSVEMDPPGPLTPSSRGLLRLANGVKTRFAVMELVPGRSWRWDGKFLWLHVSYDHRFDALPSGGTRITFVVEGRGLGSGSLGRLFAWVYAKNLDRAIPNLVAELSGPAGNA